MNWRTYLTVAQQSINQNDEAFFRTAVSRAYYAVFNSLRLKAGYNTKTEQVEFSHQKFIEALKNGEDKIVRNLNLDEDTIAIIGEKLNDLRRQRNEADYNGLIHINQKNAKQALQIAEFILQLIDN